MSFMFNPHPYDDPTAVNVVKLSQTTVESLEIGDANISKKLVKEASHYKNPVLAFDGYPTAQFHQQVNVCSGLLALNGEKCEIIDIETCLRSSDEIDGMLEGFLPEDLEKDPVLLFGRRMEDAYGTLFDMDKYNAVIDRIKNRKTAVILYGLGSLYKKELRALTDIRVYLDVAPKNVVLRAKSGMMKNLGDKAAKPFKAMMRRAYYVDFEAALALRRELLHENAIDYYIDSTNMDGYKMIDKAAFGEITEGISQAPFRNKPVYIEGVWGGQYIKKIRNIPDTVRNIAWGFDFIPMEVSIVTKIGDHTFEMPFYTLLQSQELKILGEKCAKKFGGYFPIRFNYDDTFHSSGNMSVQVHSGSTYNKENFNEFGRQDESYYIVTAGQGAKTYLGFNNGINPDEFIAEAKKSEKETTYVDYQKYVNHVSSTPGTQVLIPAGTVHASGRNQVVLEIGSLTVGSYTYKLYDYLRLDLDGKPRPIHTYHGEQVLEKSRDARWADENIIQAPRTLRNGDDWRETIIGEHELLYFSLRHLEFEKEIHDDTQGKFHVLSLVDGEKVVVRSVANPDLCYYQNYLDIVVVPASVGKYVIENLGNTPVIVHKTCLKDGFENDSL